MKKSKIFISLLLLFTCNLTYAKANDSFLTEEQMQNLVTAAWKDRPESIDITFYLEWTRPPKTTEQIRREVQDEFKKDMIASGENPPSVVDEKTRESIEHNIQRRIKIQQFPRLVNFHRLKPVAFTVTGFACPPKADVSIHQLKLVVLKSE